MVGLMRIGTGWTVGAKRLLSASLRLPMIIDRVVVQEAHLYRNAVIKSFREQKSGGKKWPSLSPITLALRRGGVGGGGTGGTKALVRSGSLRGSVKVHRKSYAKYFVGAHRTGKRGANVAGIHDTGLTVIPITKKMRGYFNYLFWKGIIPFTFPKSKRYIIIPRRSFMTDTFDEFKRGSLARMRVRFAAMMRGL